MEIATRRFLLRDFEESDRSQFLEYQADPRNFTFYKPEKSGSDHAANLLELFQNWASATPRLNYQLAIVQRQKPDALVGCCGLRGMGLTTGEMELGLELAPTYWGRYAYAIEVGQALLDFGFRRLNLDVISGSTVSANTRITRLVEWMGGGVVAIRPGSDWMVDRGWSEVDWRMTRRTGSVVEAIVVVRRNAQAEDGIERLGFKFADRRQFGDDDCSVYRLNQADWNSESVEYNKSSPESL